MPGPSASRQPISVESTKPARYSLLLAEFPGRGEITVGVLLEDPGENKLYLRLRRDWAEFAPGEDVEVLELLEEDLSAKAAGLGAAEFFRYYEDTLSNAVRLSDRRAAIVEDFDRALGRLYRQHVKSNVREFVTHLPRYSLAVAAGPFLDNRAVEAEDWEEAPPNLRLTKEMFVARVVGRSMLPLIPDGALCVFRRGVVGSRNGRLVLVEAQGLADRYTVKRYRSEKAKGLDGEWAHTRITLEPLNPEFEAWDLDPEENRYQILAEFVQTLD